ncbi:hypothetical protein [Changchengzhania lutea]|uniref:hypothetical protein n=1 Tax=Changchengzhania lutea TaxID=2049305 RepID=UPI00115CC585|nr:hypothetical protein [Changchengzhania lutea]
MKIKQIIFIMGFLSVFFGFSQKDNLVELISNQEDGEVWQDLIFSITEKEKLANGFWSLTCKAKYQNEIVGLKINIEDEIPSGKIDNPGFSLKGVEIKSIGKESDKLIEIISKLYNQPIKTKFTSEKLVFVALSLNKKIATLENGYFRFKLFFDENEQRNSYTELYLNPDLKNDVIELKEKDEEYRDNIVKILSDK